MHTACPLDLRDLQQTLHVHRLVGEIAIHCHQHLVTVGIRVADAFLMSAADPEFAGAVNGLNMRKFPR